MLNTLHDVSNTKVAGRYAGLAYLVIILFSVAGYTTMSRMLAGDARTVLGHLVANHALFSAAFVAMAIGFAAWVVLGVLLYRLMSSCGRLAGVLMVVFTVAGVAMNFVALSQLLPLLSPEGPRMDAAVLTPILRSYERLLLLAQVFSGLWLFPFGWLVVRSGIAPRFLGVCLIVAGFFYLLVFGTAFEPGLDQTTTYRIFSAATGIAVFAGEFGTCSWLLVKGARTPNRARAA